MTPWHRCFIITVSFPFASLVWIGLEREQMRPRLASEKAFEERQSIDAFDPYFQMHAQLLNVFGPLKRMLVQLTFLAACSSARFCCSSPARDGFLQAKGARRLSKACTDSAQGAQFLHCGMHECSFLFALQLGTPNARHLTISVEMGRRYALIENASWPS